jgi:hypothetical protein
MSRIWLAERLQADVECLDTWTIGAISRSLAAELRVLVHDKAS